jgi:hypothetical protein
MEEWKRINEIHVPQPDLKNEIRALSLRLKKAVSRLVLTPDGGSLKAFGPRTIDKACSAGLSPVAGTFNAQVCAVR